MYYLYKRIARASDTPKFTFLQKFKKAPRCSEGYLTILLWQDILEDKISADYPKERMQLLEEKSRDLEEIDPIIMSRKKPFCCVK